MAIPTLQMPMLDIISVRALPFMLYVLQTLDDDDDEQHRSPSLGSSPRAHESGAQNADVPESPRGEFEPCTRLEDLKLGIHYPDGTNGRDCTNEVLSARKDAEIIPLHEIIFSSLDKPKLLSQIRQAIHCSTALISRRFLSYATVMEL
ncbi:hypothetical protein FCM35_KLT16824 [Carex littledalei]|uniref:Uncharacterized protein n=1 Tax=Carex littledalei TaxID=544730 RepID=A0A833QF52_9POAL|nr:hypothetical protein FCM35_KLT08620 [Carex littledalei]KAF3339353.1 hypothetical protein FCM35_KLT16824 [Carex littledalei]